MTERVPADDIENIVGRKRSVKDHYARAVSAEQTVYVLHSRGCLALNADLRDCPWCLALDRGRLLPSPAEVRARGESR